MKKTFLIALVLFSSAVGIVAQTTDEKKYDVFIGYSNLQAEGVPGEEGGDSFDDEVFGERSGLNGFNVAATGYLTSRFGLTADFSFNQDRDRFNNLGSIDNRIDTRVMYLMGGPTVRFPSGRLTPFARALAGFANTRYEVESSTVPPGGGLISNRFTTNASDFAAAIGGGLDLKLNDRIGLRLIQIDYAPVFLRDRSVQILNQAGAIQAGTLEGQRQDNIRISVGVKF